MFKVCNFTEEFDIPDETLSGMESYFVEIFNFSIYWHNKDKFGVGFLNSISSRYLGNPYHTYKHGCDVCHTVYRLMFVSNLNLVFSNLEVFTLLVAAVAHDVGHLGVNNVFLVKARHELAIKYNDQSPLENMHLATLAEVCATKTLDIWLISMWWYCCYKCCCNWCCLKVLNTVESNIFINLSDAQSADARKILAAVILGTDMSLHFGQLSKAQVSFFLLRFGLVCIFGVIVYCAASSINVIVFIDYRRFCFYDFKIVYTSRHFWSRILSLFENTIREKRKIFLA